MPKTIRRDFIQAGARALVFLSVFFVSVACASADSTWDLVNVTLADGGTATGSYTINPLFNNLTGWNIVVTEGTHGTGTFTYTTADSIQFTANPSEVALANFGSGNYILLFLATGMTNAGGTIALTNSSYNTFGTDSYQDSVSSGEVTDPTPEPGSILMSGCGLLVLGLWMHRRRRVITVNL